jgi:1-deoxy-D-xylulose-5-phosphate synthase
MPLRPDALLSSISAPEDLRGLTYEDLGQLAAEIRRFIVETVTTTGGHLGSNLGAVELTLALHRIFESPRDVILWDTGHQAYVHKILTGRRERFGTLRQAGGISGYPSPAESDHDWIANSHASTALSYAHGIATAFRSRGETQRRVIAIVGDGALTGGMAYEALNNIGHSGAPVLIVLNDNGRSYAPTVSKLTEELAYLRLSPSYVHARERFRQMLRQVPGVGPLAYAGVHGVTSALREIVTPHRFFETLGVRYAGPIDGHDVAVLERALRNAIEWRGPILVHVLTQKGRGYAPAENDDIQRLHDFKVAATQTAERADAEGAAGGEELSETPEPPGGEATSGIDNPAPTPSVSYTEAFTQALVAEAETRTDLVAITAAMPGPTGLLPMSDRFPDRCFDVGIAEQHAVTAAAGMAIGGLRPVVAIYSTFFCRAFDQANLDVGLHGLPVTFVLDRAGITGDDGPSHHGLLDLALTTAIPGMSVFAPSSAEEVPVMLATALDLDGPSAIRFPKTPARHVRPDQVGDGLNARLVVHGDGSVCVLAIGKMVEAAEEAAGKLATEGVEATVWDVRVVTPPDPRMLSDAASHGLVVTVEDGVRVGGAGSFLADAIRTYSPASPPTKLLLLGVPRTYVAHGQPDAILAGLGLDGPGIAESIREGLATL